MTATPTESFAKLEGFTVSIGDWNGVAASNYQEVGHIEDTVTVNDGRDVTTFSDWNAAKEGISHKISEGARNISVSFANLIVLTDPAYAAMRTKYLGGTPAAIKIEMADSLGTGGKIETMEYACEITQFNRELPKNNVARLNLTFEASSIISESLANKPVVP